MLRYSSLLLGIILFSACQEAEPITKDVIQLEEIEANIPDEDLFDYDTLQGMYVGNFGGSDIRIILNYVSKTNAVGYNIHKGLQRNLSGRVTRSNDSTNVFLAEPGDHEFDGVFQLLFIGKDTEPQGTWKSNSGLISPKAFTLKRVKSGKATWKVDEDITFENLHSYFNNAYDSLGEYSFKSDGLVIFSYYPGGYWSDNYNQTEAERSKKQMKQIQGTWSMDNEFVTVAWEANKILPQSNMRYEIQKGDYEPMLFWKDNPIYMRMYP